MKFRAEDNQGLSPLTARQRNISMNCAIVSSIAAIINAGVITGAVLNLLAIKLGAGEVFLGILNFAVLIPFVAGLFTLSAVERIGKRRVLLVWFFVSSVFVLPFFLLPVLINQFNWPYRYCLIVILAATFLRSGTTALGISGWFLILQDNVPKEATGRFFGRLRTWWSSTHLIFLLAAAWFLGNEPQWWKFEVLFSIAFVSLLVRAFAIIPMTENAPLGKDAPRTSIRRRLSEVWRIKSLRHIIYYIIFYGLAASALLPFQIKMLRDLGYGAGFILAAISMVSLGSIFSLKYWGALADRFGNRAIFSISHIGMIFSALLWIVVEKSTFGSVLIFVLFFAVSVFGSGNGIAQTRYLFHAIPVNRQNHINIVNMFFFVSCAIGPLLAGLFLHFGRNWHFTSGAVDLNNYHALFLLNGLLFLLPHTLRRNLRLAEEKSTIEVMTIMTRPLRNMIGPFIHLGGGSKSPMSRDEIQKPLDWTI